mmetsp:Transcript_8012/g.21071  ORF Transcript_8012/g.21071 Transcript_8012/m.21071 type:complete len:272 (+) Transcript_8012:328-1143(+)
MLGKPTLSRPPRLVRSSSHPLPAPLSRLSATLSIESPPRSSSSSLYGTARITTSAVPSLITRLRSFAVGTRPCRMKSTLISTSCSTQCVRSRISIRQGNVAGPFLSSTLFCVPRLRASSSLSVTVCTPPMRSLRLGFFTTFSRRRPCAVPTSITPRSAIVRHASASASVPISSTITTCGMWFSTASIITRCCIPGSGTCMRRARPMAGCGMSPSPPISLDVSTTTTRLPHSSARTLAISRITVVLPTPGRPKNRMERDDSVLSIMSRIMSM